jgi:hypothetical protein
VKAAILVTLGGLIEKAGLTLKPFVPQLQTSFLKCLHDPVRMSCCRSYIDPPLPHELAAHGNGGCCPYSMSCQLSMGHVHEGDFPLSTTTQCRNICPAIWQLAEFFRWPS